MLVGRAAEQRQIDRLLAGARIGQSGVLVITGEAGIGKSTLLDYAEQAASGVRVVRAAGTGAERDIPFGGLAQLLRPTPADLDRLPQPQAQALGVALAQRAGAAADRFSVGAATLSLLMRMSEDAPLVLLVDDAHLLDAQSAQAILFAARRFLADPVVILAAVRAGEPTPLIGAGLPELTVGGLDIESTRALCVEEAGESLPVDLSSRLHELTGGNPLAITELARDPQLIMSLPADLPVPVPAAVTQWYAARVRRLGPAARWLLLLAAATGGDLAVVSHAARESNEDVGRLVEAEGAGLVRLEADRVRFTHPLAASAVYSTSTPAERRELHAAVARALPDTDDRRAWHRCEAAIGRDDVVAAEIAAVGERALARGAASVAARAFERAARLSGDGADRGARFAAAGAAAWAGGDAVLADTLLDQALAATSTPSVRVRALSVRGEIAVRTGALDRARDLLIESAGDATADPVAAAVGLAEATYACLYLGDAAGAMVVVERAEQALATGAAGRAEVMYRLAAGMARLLAGQGGADQIRAAVTLAGGSADTAEPRGNPTDGFVDRFADASADAGWLVAAPLWLRESGPVRAQVRALVDERRARTAVSQLPRLLFHIARDAATTNDWAQAEADYAEAISLGRELGHNTEVAIASAGLAWLLARMGCDEEARECATVASDLAAAQQIHLARAWVEFALGELALARGRAEEAVSALTALSTWLEQIGLLDIDVSPAPELVEALLHSGRSQAAAEIADVFAAGAVAKGQPWALARSLRASALVTAKAGDIDRASALFEDALRTHRRTPDVFELARTQLGYGAALRRSRRRAAARAELRQALDAFDHLGAQPWADAAARELEASGETAQRGEARHLVLLTQRELQVAMLLADGRTTREAAAALFLSPKTVEYHLSHVYTKLGISSRAELAHRLAERS